MLTRLGCVRPLARLAFRGLAPAARSGPRVAAAALASPPASISPWSSQPWQSSASSAFAVRTFASSSTNALHLAQMIQVASTGDLAAVKELVKEGVDPKLGDYDKRTPLHLGALSFAASRSFSLFLSPQRSPPRHSALHTRAAVCSSLEAYFTLSCCSVIHAPPTLFRHPPQHNTAAAEGHLSVVEYLVDECKVDVNPLDRAGSTPLDDAMLLPDGAHIIAALRKHGGVLGNRAAATLNRYAARGDVESVKQMLDAGADINQADRAGTYPIHAAAKAGQVDMLKFLLENGGDPTVEANGQFGSTALAQHHNYVLAQNMMREHGASTSKGEMRFAGPGLPGACVGAIPYLVQRGGFVAGEVWMSASLDGVKQAVHPSNGWSVPLPSSGLTPVDETTAVFLDSAVDNSTTGGTSTFSTAMQSVFNGDVPGVNLKLDETTYPGRLAAAKAAGITCMTLLPVKYKDSSSDSGVVHAVVVLFSTDASGTSLGHVSRGVFGDRYHEDEQLQLQEIGRFASALIAAGLMGDDYETSFQLCREEDTPAEAAKCVSQADDVYHRLAHEGIFSPNHVYSEIDYFYSMGLKHQYFAKFDPKFIASHIHAYMASKKFATTVNSPEEIWVRIENNVRMLGPVIEDGEQALWMIPQEHRKMLAAERFLENCISRVGPDLSVSLEFFTSRLPHVPDGSSKLCMYILQTYPYSKPNANPAAALEPAADGVRRAINTDIYDIANAHFLKSKPAHVIQQYQKVITEVARRLSSVANVYPQYKDGSTPIMFAFQQGKGTKACYLLQLSELLHQNGLVASRKYIENFNNGVTVYCVYVSECENQTTKINALLNQFSMLQLVPKSELTPMFLRGDVKAAQYTYLSSVARFAYYFMRTQNEDFHVLAEHMKDDPTKLSHLFQLQKGMQREAVSLSRIYSSFSLHSDIVNELYHDFSVRHDKRRVVDETPEQLEARSDQLLQHIAKIARSRLDEQILNALVLFNKGLEKTNMFVPRKSALSFRFGPNVLDAKTDWPEDVYGFFFVLGFDFQGFHVRFRDVSRGGIRVIKSRDELHYANNMGTLFKECYSLAHTQNKKNKDIAEFGSKGAVLLHPQSQGNAFIAFRKYISALMDLVDNDHHKVGENPHIVDRYGQSELLFLGPDEGTANYMKWAADYAHYRKYPYWRSITTGKPPSMGGVPHDTYGMTTRSVVQYVLGCYEKLGLDETQVTKLQTGGPDGDLGSNNIRFSKDKTTAIVDGSGVIYDPNGLDRDEMMRLADERVTIDHFDAKKLGAGGFVVLVTDENVTLPDGTFIESGLGFRNDFHLISPYSSADLFVPCGGRPESINLQNVHRMMQEDETTPRFKIIVEGANLFLTNDARRVLEESGCIVFRDASTNKGGVTSSSLEVFAALAMDSATFDANMTSDTLPFYQSYVEDIIKIVEENARLEFECIWAEHQRSGEPNYIITEQVSDKINMLNDFIQTSSLWNDKALVSLILEDAIPQSLQDLVGMDDILKNTPDSYIQAIFGSYIASRYVYKFGIAANEFAFFDYMQSYVDKKASQAKLAKSV
jgi:glutamate dehydrogenase